MDKEEVIKGLEICIDPIARRNCNGCPFVHAEGNCIDELQSNAIAMLKEQNEKIERYEYFLKVLGLEFKEWDALLKEGKAEVISTLDETDRKATVTFQLFDYEKEGYISDYAIRQKTKSMDMRESEQGGAGQH